MEVLSGLELREGETTNGTRTIWLPHEVKVFVEEKMYGRGFYFGPDAERRASSIQIEVKQRYQTVKRAAVVFKDGAAADGWEAKVKTKIEDMLAHARALLPSAAQIEEQAAKREEESDRSIREAVEVLTAAGFSSDTLSSRSGLFVQFGDVSLRASRNRANVEFSRSFRHDQVADAARLALALKALVSGEG